MVMRHIIFVAIALAACKPTGREMRALVGEVGECSCPCADAAPAVIEVDAAPDAPPDAAPDAPPDARPPIDLLAPWTRTIVTAGSPSGSYRGADGVAVDSAGCWVTPYEEGHAVSRACLVAGSWVTELVATGISPVEDAEPGDFDGDGVIDVASCGVSCQVTFRGSPNVTVPLPASTGHANMIQVAAMDVDHDGDLDLVIGSYAGTLAQPAVLAWLQNPGGASARTATWAYHPIDVAGYVMSIIPLPNGRIVVSDRSYYFGPTGTHLWDRNGVRWLEQTSPGVWASHPISPPSGACPAGQPMCSTRTPGDVMFASVDGNDVWNCQSSSGAAYSRIVRHRTTDWLTWTTTVLPAATNVGHCQQVIAVPGGVAVSTWKGNAYPLAPAIAAESGVYWLRDDGGGVWSRGEISGPSGDKFDDLALLPNGCLITSEQLGGGLGVLTYCPPGAP